MTQGNPFTTKGNYPYRQPRGPEERQPGNGAARQPGNNTANRQLAGAANYRATDITNIANRHS